MTIRTQTPPRNWFSRIRSWFTFVNGRRLDNRFAIIPVKQVTIFGLFAACLCLALILFVDAGFLELVRSGTTKGNTFFELITMIGKSDWILIGSGIVILLFTVFTADRFSGHLTRVWHRLFLTFYFIFTSVAFSGLITLFLKFLFGRSRPPFVEGVNPWEWMPFTRGYEFASFPSGHSTTSGALVMALLLLFPKFKWWFIALGILIASSRSFIGVHFPSDVLVGLAVGAGFTWLYARSFARKRLLFHFTNSGTLELRGEGRGYLNRWPALFGFGQNK